MHSAIRLFIAANTTTGEALVLVCYGGEQVLGRFAASGKTLQQLKRQLGFCFTQLPEGRSADDRESVRSRVATLHRSFCTP